MIEREKVINGLESQLDDLSKYADADEVLTLTQDQAKDILALLKKQEAKEQCLKTKFVTCERLVDDVIDLLKKQVCPHCGKKVKWNDKD